jgi:hypothetical protein
VTAPTRQAEIPASPADENVTPRLAGVGVLCSHGFEQFRGFAPDRRILVTGHVEDEEAVRVGIVGGKWRDMPAVSWPRPPGPAGAAASEAPALRNGEGHAPFSQEIRTPGDTDGKSRSGDTREREAQR